MKRLLAALLAALSLPPLCSLPAAAQQAPKHARGPWMEDGRHGMGGAGMMGACSPGMLGADWSAIELTGAQRSAIDAIRRDLRTRQSALMQAMHDSMRAARAYRGGRFDEQALRDAYAASENIHRQMFENGLDAQRRMDALLTPAQRQQLSQAGQ